MSCQFRASVPTILLQYHDARPSSSSRRDCHSGACILMTHNRKGSIAAFSISKSVEPNEEQKVLVSDSEQEITASTER